MKRLILMALFLFAVVILFSLCAFCKTLLNGKHQSNYEFSVNDGISGRWVTFDTNTYYVDPSIPDQAKYGSGRGLKDILQSIGTSQKATIIFPHLKSKDRTLFFLKDDIFVSSNFKLHFDEGALISVATGKTLLIHSPENVSAGARQQIFSGSGRVTFAKAGSIHAGWGGMSPDYMSETSRGTDQFPKWNRIYTAAAEGSEIFISPGKYRSDTAWIIGKALTLRGIQNGRMNTCEATELHFSGVSGLIVEKTYVDIRDLRIVGHDRNDVSAIDPTRSSYGQIGIELEKNDTINSGGFRSFNIEIRHFNTGVLVHKSGDANSASAYREFYTLHIHDNHIGMAFEGKPTKQTIFGGTISGNAFQGVFVSNVAGYSNIDFIGTTIEKNGTSIADDISRPAIWLYSAHNEYDERVTYDYAKISLTGCYLESQQIRVDYNCHLQMNNCYSRGNRFFGKGVIDPGNTFGYSTQLITTKDLVRVFNFRSNAEVCQEVKDIETYNAAMKITSRAKGLPVVSYTSTGFPHVNQWFRTIRSDEVAGVKLTAKIKVPSGSNVKRFGVRPIVTIHDGLGKDGTKAGIDFPNKEYWAFSSEKYVPFTYIWTPSVGKRSLTSGSQLTHLQLRFVFSDGHGLPDYSHRDSLEVAILEPTLELFTVKQVITEQLRGSVFVEAKTTDFMIRVAEGGKTFTNCDADQVITATLPRAKSSYGPFTFSRTGGHRFRIAPKRNDKIRGGNTADCLELDTEGDTVVLVCLKDSQWEIIGGHGTYTYRPWP